MWPEEKMRRWVTLYTDAGWKHGRARCGFIARGSVAPVWLQGSGEADCDSSVAAEALAVLHGLRQVTEAYRPEAGLEGVFLRSDNLHVVNTLKEHWKPGTRDRALRTTRGDTLKIVEQILDLCEERELRLRVKHVRAHGKEMNRVRRWMNRQADRLGNMRGWEGV